MHIFSQHDGQFPAVTDAFDYSCIATSVRNQVQDETQAIRTLVVSTANNIIQIGLRLQLVRQCMGRQPFQAWLRAEFQWSQSVASNYMRAAAVFANVDCLEHFQPSALYVLARNKASEAARGEALSRARTGELITKSTAEMIVSRHIGAISHEPPGAAARLSDVLETVERIVPLISDEEMETVLVRLTRLVAKLQARSRGETATGGVA